MQDGHSLNQSELAVRHFPNQLAFRRTRVIVAFRAFVELVSDYSERVLGLEFVQSTSRDPVMDLLSGQRRFLSQDCGNCVRDSLVWHVLLAFQSQRLTKRGKLTETLDRFCNGFNHQIHFFVRVKPSQSKPDA